MKDNDDLTQFQNLLMPSISITQIVDDTSFQCDCNVNNKLTVTIFVLCI